MESIETARLLIRPFTIEDLDDLYALYSQIEIMRYIDSNVRSFELTRIYLQGYIHNYTEYGFDLGAAIFKVNQKMIGRCGVIPRPRATGLEGELSFLYAKEYWGMGLATEAARAIVSHTFKNYKIDRIFSFVAHKNLASIRVLQKTGLRLVKNTPTEYEYEILRGANPSASTP